MKSLLNLFAAAAVAALCGVGCAGAASFVTWNHIAESDTISTHVATNQPTEGMFFSTDYVVEEYEYDDAYCLLYNDPDADMNNVEICVDLPTFQMVCRSIKNGERIVGSLVVSYDYLGVDIYTFIPEPEFEMADASANY